MLRSTLKEIGGKHFDHPGVALNIFVDFWKRIGEFCFHWFRLRGRRRRFRLGKCQGFLQRRFYLGLGGRRYIGFFPSLECFRCVFATRS